MTHVEIMRRVQQTREMRGYTQEYVAQQLGITQGAYHYIENAKRADVGIGVLIQLSHILKVDVCHWLGCTEPNVSKAMEDGGAYRTQATELELVRTQLQSANTRISDLEKLIDSKDKLIAAYESRLNNG